MSVGPNNELPKIPNLKLEEISNTNIDTNNNNLNNINNFKTISNNSLFTRKINKEEISKGEIINLIHKSFNDPEYYFSEESPVNVGSKIKLKKIDLFAPKEGRRYSNLKTAQKKVNVSSSKASITEQNKSTSFGKQKQINTLNIDKKYELIDNIGLKNIFEKFKENKRSQKNLKDVEMSISRSINNLNRSKNDANNSNNRNNSEINNLYSFDLFKSLKYQNKQINANKKREKKVIKLSKYLSKKLNKDENDLLLNKVDLFKYKKEILNGINDDNSPKEEKFGKFQWNMNLRRYNEFIGSRQLHVNVNSERNPFWGIIVDRYPDYKERAVKPGYNLDQKEFKKFAQNQNITKNKKYVNKVKNLDDLNVNGSNLLDLEFKREMSSKGRKILHKVFVENGKMVFDKDINDVFGEETIYKNYGNKNINTYNNDNNLIKSEDNNFLYKYNKKGKNNRIISSVSRGFENSRSLDSFNNS